MREGGRKCRKRSVERGRDYEGELLLLVISFLCEAILNFRIEKI